jgi:hypothetical protein
VNDRRYRPIFWDLVPIDRVAEPMGSKRKMSTRPPISHMEYTSVLVNKKDSEGHFVFGLLQSSL